MAIDTLQKLTVEETDDPAAVLRIEAISCDLRLADAYWGVLSGKK